MKIRGSGRSPSRAFIRRLRDSYRERRIAETWIKDGRERVRVSTIFETTAEEDRWLARICPIGSPLYPLYEATRMETMVFGGELDKERLYGYPSRLAAREGHRVVAFRVRVLIAREQRRRQRLSRMHSAYRARRA